SVSCVKVWLGLSDSESDADVDYDDTYLVGQADRSAERDLQRCGLSVVRMRDPGGRLTVAITALVPAGTEVSRAQVDGLVDRVETEMMPRLRARALVIETATPRTFERFTRNPGGSIYGCASTVQQVVRRTSSETPIGGLWLAGAWTQPGAGFSSVMRSGRAA